MIPSISRAARVLFITPYYWPELIGSAPYCTDVAEWLARHGRRTLVLTCWPHYPRAEAFSEHRTAGRRHEFVNGVEILRIRFWTPRHRGAAARIFGELMFLISGLSALATRRIRREPLVLSLCPSIFGVALGIVTTKRSGRHVAIVHDIQSGLAEGLRMVGGSFLPRLMRWCERSVLNRVHLIAVLSEEMRRQLRDNGIRTPIEVMPIWADTELIRPLPEAANGVHVVYSGNFGRKQGLGQVVSLAEALQACRPDITVVLRGSGGANEALVRSIAQRGLSNIQFAELVPRDALSSSLAQGHIHLVPQEPQGADFAVPSKVFNIMAAGRSFVATAPAGTALWNLQQSSGAFLCVPPNNTAAFVEAVLRLADDDRLRRELGSRGQRFVEQHHAKDKVLDDFMRRLDELCPG